MKNSSATEILRIQEGEWIITLPVEENSTILDLKYVVEQLRFRSNESLILKAGWRLDHI